MCKKRREQTVIKIFSGIKAAPWGSPEVSTCSITGLRFFFQQNIYGTYIKQFADTKGAFSKNEPIFNLFYG